MDRSQLEQDLTIRANLLDDEWVNFPPKLFSYTEQVVEAEQILERIELKRDTLMAQLDETARNSGEKMTEARVKNWIIAQPVYQEVEEERIKARYEVSMLKAVVKALDSQRKALEKLVDLYLVNYYSEPKRSSVSEQFVESRLHAELERAMAKHKEKNQ